MKRIIAWILVLASCFGMLSMTASAASLPFTDVPSDAYYAAPVAWAVEKGITKGVTDTTFAPDATCTRGQVVTFLHRAAGSPEPTKVTHNFTDISENDYYYKAVLWAVEQGITNGTSDTTFTPDGICTRGQVVTFLHRAAGSPEPANATHSFTDISESAYYYKAVLWAVEQGITNGTSDTTFAPDGTCTRGQVVTFLYRYFSTKETPETKPENNGDRPGSGLTLVESPFTVENGDMLRGNTYAVINAETQEETKVVYFPVTMFNYDQTTINAATDEMDDDLTVREGFYFSNGGSEVLSTVTTPVSMAPGKYYIQNVRASQNITNSWLQAHEENKIHGVAQSNATLWTLTFEDGEYYLSCELDDTTYYMVVGTSGGNDRYTTDKTPITITPYSSTDDNQLQLSQNGYYLCQWGGSDVVDYGGYNVNNDPGNAMRFYAVDDDGNVSDTATVLTRGESYVSAGYEAWNRWAYNSADNSSQNKVYTGLVQDTLINDQIQFNVNEPGIFDNNSDIKDIYTYVGLPFVLGTDGYYTFNSDANGAYFADTDDDGDSDPQSGTANEPYNLHFDENTQGWTGMEFGDGSTNLWAPFNTNENDTSAGTIDYHFGMRADIPFSMNANGRVKATDDNSTPVTFTFSGDDDVWVFIDGYLVIDLGGIHNRLAATIDFAANTITYYRPEANTKTTLDIGSHNDPDFATTQKLFTDSEGPGLINSTRDAFASIPDHEMQVFYLERGEGASNSAIKFNLPMNDTVLITKDATKSWSSAQDEADGDNGDGTQDLTVKEQAAVNNLLFGFTLYKMDGAYLDENGDPIDYSDDEELTPYPVASTKYFILDADGNTVGNGTTDANGKFYLKNGQTAKFITDIPAGGVTYFVQEDETPDGFLTPDYKYAGTAVNGFSYNGMALVPGTETVVTNKGHVSDAAGMGEHELPMAEEGTVSQNQSYIITAWGSTEATDSLEFICINYLDENLPKPSAFATEDIIVLDYGLPVQIDPLSNDVIRGEDVEIVAWGDETLTLTEVLDSYGFAVPDGTEGGTSWTTPTTNFHSGTVEFNDVTYTEAQTADGDVTYTRDTFTYTLNKQLTEVEVISYIIKVTATTKNPATNEDQTVCRYSLAKIYIVPATTMYYEENFGNLVTFKNGKGTWDAATEAGSVTYQEPGVVGTVGDSPYGSDVAYLDDSGDSNGTSRHGDTTNGAIQFSYSFTGTGSSFFARTTDTTGYMQIKLYEGTDTTGNYKDIAYRDTYYETDNSATEDDGGTLYNIPVYTTEDLPYGTYTLVVTVAKAGTVGTVKDENARGFGKDFFLDGIRIVQPLNERYVLKEGNSVPDTITEKALGAYATDGESNVDIVTLRYKLITDTETDATDWNFVVFTDTNDVVTTAEEYESNGPKEEIYLKPGQSVSFSIKYWHQDGYLLHLGMKAPFGTAGVQVGQNTFELKNAPDCYYNITGMQTGVVSETDKDGKTYYIATYTITATDGIVSLTNLKVTGNYQFELVENVDIDVDGSYGEDGN